MFTFLIALFSFTFTADGWGQYTIDFDGANDATSASNYGFSNHDLGGITWSGDQVIIPTTPLAADWFNGVRSLRLRGYGDSHFTMTQDKPNGIGTISFLYRRYGTEAQVAWRVEYTPKFYNLDENLASVNGQNHLSIESRALPVAGETVPLFTNQYRRTSYVFEIALSEINDIEVYLKDYYTGSLTELTNNQTTLYAFQVDPAVAASIAVDRFEIVFEKLLSTGDVSFGNGFVLFPNPSQGEINIATRGIAGQDVQLSISSILGQTVYNNTQTVNPNGMLSMDASGLANGVYILKLTGANGGQFTTKFVKR